MITFIISIKKWVYTCGVVTYVLDYNIVVSEFELQSGFYVHFRTNTLEKRMNLFMYSVMD